MQDLLKHCPHVQSLEAHSSQRPFCGGGRVNLKQLSPELSNCSTFNQPTLTYCPNMHLKLPMSNIIGKRIKPIIRKWWQFFNEITQYVACSEGAPLTERSISFLRIQTPHVSEANIGPEQPDRHKLVPSQYGWHRLV